MLLPKIKVGVIFIAKTILGAAGAVFFLHPLAPKTQTGWIVYLSFLSICSAATIAIFQFREKIEASILGQSIFFIYGLLVLLCLFAIFKDYF